MSPNAHEQVEDFGISAAVEKTETLDAKLWQSTIEKDKNAPPRTNDRRFFDTGSPVPLPTVYINEDTGSMNVKCMDDKEFHRDVAYFSDRFGCLSVRYEAEMAFKSLNLHVSPETYRMKIHFNLEKTYETDFANRDDRNTLTIFHRPGKNLPLRCALSIWKHGPIQQRGSPYATCVMQLHTTYHDVRSTIIKSTLEARTRIQYPEHTFSAFKDFDTHICYWHMTVIYKRMVIDLWVKISRDCRFPPADESRFSGNATMKFSCITPVPKEDFADIYNSLYHYYRFMVETDDGTVEPLMPQEKLFMFLAATQDLTEDQKASLLTMRINYWKPQFECSNQQLAQMAKVGSLFSYCMQDRTNDGKVLVKDNLDFVDTSIPVASRFICTSEMATSSTVKRSRPVCTVRPLKRFCPENKSTEVEVYDVDEDEDSDFSS